MAYEKKNHHRNGKIWREERIWQQDQSAGSEVLGSRYQEEILGEVQL